MARRIGILNLLPLFVLLLIVFNSCSIGKDNKEKKIEGTWKLVNLYNKANPPQDEYWQFLDGTYTFLLGDPPQVVSIGEYAVEQKISKATISIAFSISSYGVAGDWEIHELKSSELILILDEGGLLIKEFERSN